LFVNLAGPPIQPVAGATSSSSSSSTTGQK
jgi:hypothetical protein